MKIWFLRIKHPQVSRESVRKVALAPIAFAKVPVSDLRLGMDEEQISDLVDRIYKNQESAARRAHKGTLRRFLSDAASGDWVGIQVNRDPEMLFGRFVDGQIRQFPGLASHRIKGRPFVVLTSDEEAQLKRLPLPTSVRSYRGTFCNWLNDDEVEIDLPDKAEEGRRKYYSAKQRAGKKQIKFIRVGADLGCGQRLSRIFPGNYYHFIPIPKHNDPEFCRFTYGDVAERKRMTAATKGRSLMNLRQDDVLVFYAGFDAEKGNRRLVGIFAYLIVKEAYIFLRSTRTTRALRFDDLPRDFDPFGEFSRLAKQATWQNVFRKYGKWNAHIDEVDYGRIEVIICGRRSGEKSRLLTKVECLASFERKTRNYPLDAASAKKWGLNRGHDLKMSPVRTVDPEQVERVYKQLRALA